MAEEASKQAKPFAASSTFQPRSDEESAITTTITDLKFRQRNCIKICGCITAFFLIFAVTILILSLTVFHVKDPAIVMNRIILINGSQLTANLTYLADVSVKNPNVASFKFNSGTTTVFHGGEVIGEGVSPAGVAKARRTVHMNVTVVLIPRKIMEIPSLMNEVMNSGSLSMNSSTVIEGKVKIMKMIKKHLTVEVNCSGTYHLKSQEIQQNCRSRFL